MPEPTGPLRWKASIPGHYWAQGGWAIDHEPATSAPDRPWVLRRHGRLVARCHTLRIARHTANRTTAEGAPPMPDPTAPLSERTPEQLSAYVDDHLIMALVGAHLLGNDRDTAEDYLRDRLVAISDSWPTSEALDAEDQRRRTSRVHAAIFGGSR